MKSVINRLQNLFEASGDMFLMKFERDYIRSVVYEGIHAFNSENNASSEFLDDHVSKIFERRKLI